MGKVVILGGNARSGKTTLAYELLKKGFNRISLDTLESYIEDGLKIDFEKLDDNTKFIFFETIVNNAIDEANNEDINIVIDMYDYLPHDIVRLDNKDKIEVYFLAYPNCSIEEIKYNVIHYAKPTDWIAQVNEEYLNECVDRFFKRNKILVKECETYNMKLYDTSSGEKRNEVLKDLLEEITNTYIKGDNHEKEYKI